MGSGVRERLLKSQHDHCTTTVLSQRQDSNNTKRWHSHNGRLPCACDVTWNACVTAQSPWLPAEELGLGRLAFFAEQRDKHVRVRPGSRLVPSLHFDDIHWESKRNLSYIVATTSWSLRPLIIIIMCVTVVVAAVVTINSTTAVTISIITTTIPFTIISSSPSPPPSSHHPTIITNTIIAQRSR